MNQNDIDKIKNDVSWIKTLTIFIAIVVILILVTIVFG